MATRVSVIETERTGADSDAVRRLASAITVAYGGTRAEQRQAELRRSVANDEGGQDLGAIRASLKDRVSNGGTGSETGWLHVRAGERWASERLGRRKGSDMNASPRHICKEECTGAGPR